VEWIYQLRVAGVVAHAPDRDRELARSYANAYLGRNGPQASLVRQWMGFIEGQK
jgi:hypothetical protein